MGNLDEEHTETIICRHCGAINEVEIITQYDTEDKEKDYSVELSHYTVCTQCNHIFTDMDLPV